MAKRALPPALQHSATRMQNARILPQVLHAFATQDMQETASLAPPSTLAVAPRTTAMPKRCAATPDQARTRADALRTTLETEPCAPRWTTVDPVMVAVLSMRSAPMGFAANKRRRLATATVASPAMV